MPSEWSVLSTSARRVSLPQTAGGFSLLPWALGLASEAHQLTICWRWLTLVNIGKAASEYALFSLGARWEPIRVSAPIDAPTLLSIEKVKKELC